MRYSASHFESPTLFPHLPFWAKTQTWYVYALLRAIATGIFVLFYSLLLLLFFSCSMRSVWIDFVHLLKTYIHSAKSKILNQPSYHGIKSTMAIPNIHVIHANVDQILATLPNNSPALFILSLSRSIFLYCLFFVPLFSSILNFINTLQKIFLFSSISISVWCLVLDVRMSEYDFVCLCSNIFFFSVLFLLFLLWSCLCTYNTNGTDTFITRIFTANHFESVFAGINIGSVCQPHNHETDSFAHTHTHTLTHSQRSGTPNHSLRWNTFTENPTNEQISFRKMVNKLLVIRIFVYLFDSIISFSQVLPCSLARSFHSFVCSLRTRCVL